MYSPRLDLYIFQSFFGDLSIFLSFITSYGAQIPKFGIFQQREVSTLQSAKPQTLVRPINKGRYQFEQQKTEISTCHCGLLYIKNPFTAHGQRYWVVRSLQDFTKEPNKSNLDVHKVIPLNETWWQFCQNRNDLLQKLRWITMGYHHNWDTKIYDVNSKSDFPKDLTILCSYFAQIIGFHNFKAEAAIINYYNINSTLSGHVDKSEINLNAPLFSFSFGQSAIFLIGGRTLDVEPAALFLHTGDIVIMSKESRICYHGIPKIICWKKVDSNNLNEQESDCEIHEEFNSSVIGNCTHQLFWKPFAHYLDKSRININVRQVHFT